MEPARYSPGRVQPRVFVAACPPDLLASGYSGYIFDWDGTLADSHTANFGSIRHALEQQGIDITADWFNMRTGLTSLELARTIGAERDISVDLPQAVRDRDEHYLRAMHSVKTIPPVLDALERFRMTGLPIALATGGGRKTVLPTVRALGLERHFDVIVTRDDVRSGKPSPDVFLEAARGLALDPTTCLVFEDSDQGLRAAREADMDAIDVRSFRADITDVR